MLNFRSRELLIATFLIQKLNVRSTNCPHLTPEIEAIANLSSSHFLRRPYEQG